MNVCMYVYIYIYIYIYISICIYIHLSTYLSILRHVIESVVDFITSGIKDDIESLVTVLLTLINHTTDVISQLDSPIRIVLNSLHKLHQVESTSLMTKVRTHILDYISRFIELGDGRCGVGGSKDYNLKMDSFNYHTIERISTGCVSPELLFFKNVDTHVHDDVFVCIFICSYWESYSSVCYI